MPVALRADVSSIPITDRLAGMTFAVRKVRDLRPERAHLGEHRDGFGRVKQFDYAPGTDVRAYIERLTQLSLAASGAELAEESEADVLCEVDILAVDVTTDGALAGEETFGVVRLGFRFVDQKRTLLAERVVEKRFHDDELSDRGLVGDALKDAVLVAVGQAPRAMPAGEPKELAQTR
jgi:hypothetical protein